MPSALPSAPARRGASWPARFAVFGVLLVVSVVAARGTLRQGPPLRWGDAFTTASTFANHLGQNATLSLYDAARNRFSSHRDNSWKATLPVADAQAIARELLLTATASLLANTSGDRSGEGESEAVAAEVPLAVKAAPPARPDKG